MNSPESASKLPSEELKRKIERLQPAANVRENELIRKLQQAASAGSGRRRRRKRKETGFWGKVMRFFGI